MKLEAVVELKFCIEPESTSLEHYNCTWLEDERDHCMGRRLVKS